MEKKVVKKLKCVVNGTAQMTNTRKLQKNPNDECYTPMKDIANELSYWGEKFTGKRIICPCDWDILEGEDVYSMTVEFSDKKEDDFFSPTYFVNKVEKISYSLFEDPLQSFEITQPEAEEFWKSRITCNFFRYLIKAGEQYGAKSVTASGYDPETEKGYSCLDVDYSKYDLVITNPPFSLLSKFLPILMSQAQKRKNSEKQFDFIILAPSLNRLSSVYESVQLQTKKLYFGYGEGIHITFENKGNKKVVLVDWLTTFSDAQDERDSKPTEKNNIKFEDYKDEYEIMENFNMKDGTVVYRIPPKLYPNDFYGWAFGALHTIGVLNNKEFEFWNTYTSSKTYKNKYGLDCPWEDAPNCDHHKYTLKNGETKASFIGYVYRRRKEVLENE